MIQAEAIVYEFSRPKVERGDFSAFLERFAFDRLPTGRRLRVMMNSMVFCIHGWDHDPREIHCIPEIRSFYRNFHEAWPYWLYFCSLDVDTLRAMVLCCLRSFTALSEDGNPNVKVEYDPLELIEFLKRDFAPMNAVCERAGVFENLIETRTNAVFQYFGFFPEKP
ncbi:MAG: hypothetical protein AB7O66_22730 [Limisphaerales bacterium]